MPLYSSCRTYLFRIPTFCCVEDAQGIRRWETGWSSGTNWDTTIRAQIADPYASTIIGIGRTLSKEDLQVRAARMMAAMHLSILYDAAAFGGLAGNDQVLRLFVAPEFYFRCKTTPYSQSDCNELMTALAAFLKSYNSPGEARVEVKNWLFLLGTIVYQAKVARYWPRLPKNELVAFSVGRDGIPKRRLIQKCVASDLDGPDPFYWYSDKRVVACNCLEADWNHYFSDSGVFVEICLEHDLGVMLQFVQRYGTYIPLQVISAAGMLAELDKTFINVPVIRSDGSAQWQMVEWDAVGMGGLMPQWLNRIWDMSFLW